MKVGGEECASWQIRCRAVDADPSDQAKVWVAGEYARVEGGSEWGTWVAEIQLP